MGQKVNSIGLRVGIIRTWDARWFEKANYAKRLHEDLQLRRFLKKRLKNASVSKIVIECPGSQLVITLFSARPGFIIGKKGADIERLRADICAALNRTEVAINLQEIRKPELDATLVAENLASQLERRIPFRRAMRRVVQNTMRMGAEGIRISCAGRLGGAEIARTEWYREGRVPLHTLRADVDYGTAQAYTTYGLCGVKVWICRGEVISYDPMAIEHRNNTL